MTEVNMMEISLFDDYQRAMQREIMIAFSGPISDRTLVCLSEAIKTKLETKKEKKKIIKKVFSVFIELAKNICLYSAEKSNDGEGILFIENRKENYMLTAGNLIENYKIAPLINRINHINKLDRNELKKYYKEKLKYPISHGNSGNIGLIIIARKSGNQIKSQIHLIDGDFSFIEISILIDKNEGLNGES